MKKTTIKTISFILSAGILIAAGSVFYLFNLPHRNVQAAATDYSLNAQSIVNEYLKDATASNKKYLEQDGNSKILAVSGKVYSITEDLKQQKVILLKDSADKAGVSCTFTAASNAHVAGISLGEAITVKGVIRSGAGYDSDLGLYENVIMEKCDLTK